jgi:hypothetical protein
MMVARKHEKPLVRAQRIEVESPQEAHGRFRGLGTDSLVFLPACGQKNAPFWLGKGI